MGIAENKQIIRDLYNANNRGDVKGFMAFLDDDVRWTNIGSTPFSGSFNGKENIYREAALQAGVQSFEERDHSNDRQRRC